MLVDMMLTGACCREPFAKPRGWLAWGLLGVILSPFVVGSTAALFSAAGYDVRTPPNLLYDACRAWVELFKCAPSTHTIRLPVVCEAATFLCKVAEPI